MSLNVISMDNSGFLIEVVVFKPAEQFEDVVASMFAKREKEIVKRYYAEDSNKAGMYIKRCIDDVTTGAI